MLTVISEIKVKLQNVSRELETTNTNTIDLKKNQICILELKKRKKKLNE